MKIDIAGCSLTTYWARNGTSRSGARITALVLGMMVAFVTKDSTYKDQLQIPGIGKCKGAGRIQFFHHFDKLAIDSTFEQSGEVFRRTLLVDDRPGGFRELV